MSAHPIDQPIHEIDVYIGDECREYRAVGINGVTRIEACEKPGPYCAIPYLRVWKGDVCEAEFCQHNIIGVYYAPTPDPAEFAEVFDPDHADGCASIERGALPQVEHEREERRKRDARRANLDDEFDDVFS